VKIDVEQIRGVITNEVLKREVMEGDKAAEARRKLARAVAKQQKVKEAKAGSGEANEVATTLVQEQPVSLPAESAAEEMPRATAAE
jgi:hypothetical protein